MGVKVQAVFIGGATVRVRAYVYDDDDALVDPTSASVTIIDPDSTTQVDDTAMEETDTGIRDYFYNTDSDTTKGHWRGTVKVVDGSGDTAKTSIEPFGFEIK
jgi:hypothetical protein